MLFRTAVIASLLITTQATAEKVNDSHASFIDVAARRAYIASTPSSLVRDAIKHAPSCIATSTIPAPTGHFTIPSHYLNGSHGPTNPAEAEATRVYNAFEKRITAGMNQYVATGSHAEAACALAQLDAWARGNALLDYDAKESPQAWYQTEWTLCSAGITMSVLVTDPTLDAAQQKRVIQWLDTSAHKLLSFEKPGEGNNHHYWKALAATAIGVVASDNELFNHGVDVYKEAIGQLDDAGAFPLEMARHERATHYQAFALQPLVPIAEFAERQGIDLYAYQSHKHTLRDAIIFLGRAIDDPSLVKPYTSDEQMAGYGGSDYAPFVFYVARFGPDGIPSPILNGLKKPTEATRIGGNSTILAAK
jgi:poly(beta-D-mannuronate) lyase